MKSRGELRLASRVTRTTSGRNWHEIRMMTRPTHTPTSSTALLSPSFRRAREMITHRVRQTSRMTSVQTFDFTQQELRDLVAAFDVLIRVASNDRRRMKIVREFFETGYMRGNI